MKQFLFFLVIVFFSVACTHESEEATDLPCGGISDVSFTNDVQPLLQTYCYDSSNGGCHYTGGGAPGIFETYNGVNDIINTIESRVFSSQDMPPSYSQGPITLEMCDREIIRVWIDEGALNN